MRPQIKILQPGKLIGLKIKMSLEDDKTFELWRSFMPRRKEIKNAVGTDLYSMQIYDKAFDYKSFTPAVIFEKWAAVEVSDFKTVPEGMAAHELAGGAYAVFNYIGTPDNFKETFHNIFGVWLPEAGFVPDAREHFEVLGEKYKHNAPDSEEEIWIPVKDKD